MIQVSKEMSFIVGMKDKMIQVKQGNVLHSWDEGQMDSSKQGNVLHNQDEGQNDSSKARKCPS
nr:hypothetical protein [Neobacillus sp. Marseille-Q6967]